MAHGAASETLTARTPLVLCADDYGMNASIGVSIRRLAAAGRISATSCMTNASSWPAEADSLRLLRGRIGIGLHLTLTWGRPLGEMPTVAPAGVLPTIGVLIRQSLAGRNPRVEVATEIERQLTRFVDWFGHPPDHVDGHQHVQALPGIRGPLLDVLRGAGLAGKAWIRDPAERPAAVIGREEPAKAALVGGLATGFRAAAERAGFLTNRGFSGFSAFDPERDYEAEMAGFLSRLGTRPLVMCHPGTPRAEAPDPAEADEIAAARPREEAYLASDRFAHRLEAAGLVLVPAPG